MFLKRVSRNLGLCCLHPLLEVTYTNAFGLPHYTTYVENVGRPPKTMQLQDQALTSDVHGKTRSSWLNCELRDNESVYWDSLGHYDTVAVDS